MPNATNENMVAERTIDGDKPAIKANSQSEIRIMANFKIRPLRCLGSGFKRKFRNSKINPTCNPETERI